MRKHIKEDILQLIESMHEAHEEIKNAIEEQDFAMAQNLLSECQECAIHLGEVVEHSEGEGVVTISCLEQYCEVLFQVYEGLIENLRADKALKILKQALLKVENSVRNDIPLRKEVVFFPYKASMWDSLESVYLKFKQDEKYDVYCVPIPYFERNADGSIGKVRYEGKEYPNNIEVIDWQSYNLEERRPDSIYIHNPYDEINLVTCVHPNYFSKNLKKYTEELVYIPYFVHADISVKDRAAVEKMRHFCLLPGVINADKVILQSENIRQIYIQEYTNALKEADVSIDSKVIEAKFVATGSPKFDKICNTHKENLDIPAEWLKIIQKPDGSWKKIVLYNTSLVPLLNHNEQMLVKMEQVFEIFKEYKDEIAFLWRPHPLIPTTIQAMRPQLSDKYEEIVRKYQNEAWGIYDNTSDVDRAVVLCDMYYGDHSSVVMLAKQKKRPVYIQDVHSARERVIVDEESVELLKGKKDDNVLEAKEKVRVLFEDFVLLDNTIWFCAQNFNSLYSMNLLTNEVTLCGTFPNEIYSKSRLYSSMKLIGRKIYFIPFHASTIAVYDIDGGSFSSIEIDEERIGVQGKMLFMGMQQYENYLFIFPVQTTAIIRLNTIDDTIVYITEWYEKNKEMFFDNIYFLKQSILLDSKLYVPFYNANAILEMDCNTLQTTIYRIGKEKRGYTGICFDGTKIWLAPTNSRNLVKWDKGSDSISESMCEDGMDLQVYYPYIGIVYYNDVLAFPVERELCGNSVNEEVKIMCGKFAFVKEEKDYIAYYNSESGILTFINKIDGSRKSVEITIERKKINMQELFWEFEEEKIETSLFGVKQCIGILLADYSSFACI